MGVYLNEPRHTIPRRPDDDLLAWLIRPDRATAAQLAALVAAARAPNKRPPNQPRRPVTAAPAPEPRRTTPILVPTAPLAPIKGWERWPECQRTVALEGPLAGKRNAALIRLANEAVENGERDQARIVALLTAMPIPNSHTSDAQHRHEALGAAKGALKLYAANDARRFAGCPHIPYHSGNPTTSRQRDAIQHACTRHAAANCPVLRRFQANQNIPAFAHIIRSSIWRDGRGKYGKGISPSAKEVYKLLLSRSGGDPAHSFEASTRWIEAMLEERYEIGLAAIRSALKQLRQHNLIERVTEDYPIWRVPRRSSEWIVELEAQLGTDKIRKNRREDRKRHWHANTHFRDND
jgi:hypothetical protein